MYIYKDDIYCDEHAEEIQKELLALNPNIHYDYDTGSHAWWPIKLHTPRSLRCLECWLKAFNSDRKTYPIKY